MPLGSTGSRARGAALALAALVALAAAARAEDPAPEEAPPPYQTRAPDELRGTTLDPGDRVAASREPRFVGPAALSEREGGSRPLGALSRSPGPEPANDRDETDGPGFLRLSRRPGEGPDPHAPLDERYCDAERELAVARRSERDAARAYARALRDAYPRGAAKALVIEGRALAERRLRRARAARDALLAEADEEGVDLDPAVCGEPQPER